MTQMNKCHLYIALLSLIFLLACPAFCLTGQMTADKPSEAKNEATGLDQISKQIEDGKVPDSSYDILAQIIKKDPSAYRAHLLLGDCYDLLGLPDLARQQYVLALKYGPNDPQAVIALVKLEGKAGHISTVESLLNNARKRFPTDPEIIYWTGTVLYAQNKTKAAEAMFNQAMSSGKTIIGLPSALALIRLKQKYYREALMLANRDIAQKSTLDLANEVAGVALMELHDYGRAVKPLQIAFMKQPLKKPLAEEYMRALYWTGDYKSALRPALINLALNPSGNNNRSTKAMLAGIIQHTDRKDLLALIKEVSGKFGIEKSAAFHLSLGEVLADTKYNDLALEQLSKAVELDPSLVDGWYNLGLVQEMACHDYKKAWQSFEKAHSLAPNNEEIAKRLLRLEDRLSAYNDDWAWRLKDWLQNAKWLD
jgi:tetratricopeptide (TPR) repeat protein